MKPPEMSTPQPAPTIAEILTNPEKMAEHAQIPAYIKPYGMAHGRAQGRTIVETTESVLLTDFYTKIAGIAAELSADPLNPSDQRRAEDTQALADGVRFVGHQMMTQASDIHATHWINAVRSKESTGTLFVGVHPGKSSVYAYDMAMQAVRARDADAAAAIHPIDSSRARTFKNADRKRLQHIAASKLFFVDDWSLSGSQLGAQINELTTGALPPESLEIYLACAPEKHLQSGIQGIQVHAPYYHTYRHSQGTYDPSLAGPHGYPDFGFSFAIDHTYYTYNNYLAVRSKRRQAQALEQLEYPLLHDTIKAYAPSDEERRQARRHHPVLHERIQRCSQIAASLLNIADPHAPWPK